jgi:hypothetical protein
MGADEPLKFRIDQIDTVGVPGRANHVTALDRAFEVGRDPLGHTP